MRGLACPPSPQRSDCLEQLLRVLPVGADIVIPEHERPPGHPAHLLHDFGDRPAAHAALIHCRYRAVIAIERAPARRDRDSLSVDAAFDQIPTGRRHLMEIGKPLAPVRPCQSPFLAIAQHMWPDQLPFPHDHRIGMPGNLLGHQGGMGPSDDNRDAYLAILGRHFVGMRRRRCVCGNSDKRERLVKPGCFNDLVGVRHFPVWRRVRGEEGHGELWESDDPSATDVARVLRFCGDQLDPISVAGRDASCSVRRL